MYSAHPVRTLIREKRGGPIIQAEKKHSPLES